MLKKIMLLSLNLIAANAYAMDVQSKIDVLHNNYAEFNHFTQSVNPDMLRKFATMRCSDLQDETLSLLLQISLRYGIVHGHVLWDSFIKASDDELIPSPALTNATIGLIQLIRLTPMESYTERTETAYYYIQKAYENYRKKGLPLTSKRGNFFLPHYAQVSVSYLDHAITNFDELKKDILADTSVSTNLINDELMQQVKNRFYPGQTDYTRFSSVKIVE